MSRVSSSSAIKLKKLLAKESLPDIADVSAMEARALVSEIIRLEARLDPSKLPNPVSYYTMNSAYIYRVLIEDWEIFGGVSKFDWEKMYEHKRRIETLLYE